jgi:hypothetical protein
MNNDALARKLFRAGSRLFVEPEFYRQQLAAFRRKFGREMGPDDPFFFDPDAETPQFRPPEDAEYAIDRIAELMAESGIGADAIYAFKRTRGLFPTESRPLSLAEADEWNTALHEYRRKLERNPKQ